jgi:hypothetical protein
MSGLWDPVASRVTRGSQKDIEFASEIEPVVKTPFHDSPFHIPND